MNIHYLITYHRLVVSPSAASEIGRTREDLASERVYTPSLKFRLKSIDLQSGSHEGENVTGVEREQPSTENERE